MNVAVLNGQEEFITFLNPDYLELIEVAESDNIKRIEVKYITTDFIRANELFKQGNKLYVKGNGNISTGLYVINTSVTKDLYLENCINFTAEEILVELNYAPLFSQTDLTANNRFTLNKVNGENTVTVNYEALNYWFGHYYNIGVVQDCLTTLASRITPRGTMTLMELFRYIEEETGNRFVTRYEKDPNSNTIFRFLDFLNPDHNDKAWTFTHEFHLKVFEYDGELDEEEDSDIIGDTPYQPLIDDLVLRFIKDGKVITVGNTQLEFKARDIGFSEDKQINQLKIVSNGTSSITITVNNVTFTKSSEEVTSQNPVGSYTTINDDPTNITGILPNHTQIMVLDTSNNKTLFIHEINPVFGDVHNTVLDLGFNVENMVIETDETDTYTSVSPILNFDNSEYTPAQISNIINNWKNLSVNKGDRIPLFVERAKLSNHPTTGNPTNYYSLPQNPQDDMDNGQYDYFVASSYWYAPFTKKAGDLSVSLDSPTDINYTEIYMKPDVKGGRENAMYGKNGVTECNDEDKYNIYSQVVQYLKEHKTPKVTIKTDVAELKDNRFNDFKLNDKVYLKIPTYDQLISARVTSTTKNSKNIAENKIELDNYSFHTITPLMETIIIGDNVEFDYPKTGSLLFTLYDANDNPIPNALVSATLYDSSNAPVGVANNVKTNALGKVTIPYKLDPGEYSVNVYYPENEVYDSSSATFTISVGGFKEETQTTSAAKTTAKKDTNKYWSKYGQSPNKKYIMGIGKKSHKNDKGKSGKYYRGIFKNKCPVCGKAKLGYGIFFGKKESSTKGKMPFTKSKTSYANKGVIKCKHCKTTFSVQGNAHGKNKKLTRVKSVKNSTKAEAYKIINGKHVYNLKITKNTKKTNTKKKVNHTPVYANQHLSKKVKEKAAKIVGKKTGLDAVKAIAAFMGKIKYDGYCDFKRSSDTVLSHGGNCCDQARTFCELCDAAGLTEYFKFEYIYVCCGPWHGQVVGHVFTKVTTRSSGKSRYVDPTCNRKGPYGHYNSDFGRPYRKKTTYPTRPF